MLTIGDVVRQNKQSTEDRFFTNLMQYAMSNETTMPNKTQMWNQYLSLKGGRLSSADIANFESQYANVKSAVYQNQLKELDNMALSGDSIKDIRKKVKNDEVLYNNLLDLISDLKASGTEEGMMTALNVQSYLPQKEDAPLIDKASDFISESPIMAGAGAYGVYKAGQKIMSGKPGALSKAIGLEDVSKKKTAKSKRAARIKNIRKLTPRLTTAGISSMVAPEIGEFIGGETGRQVGQTVGSGMITGAGLRGLLGLMSKAPASSVPSAIAKGVGYAGLAAYGADEMTGGNVFEFLSNKLYGDEE
tara:strand:- start:237 stop:1148 length:912 start_codon:yes stop_codon:yes gene_type:complete